MKIFLARKVGIKMKRKVLIIAGLCCCMLVGCESQPRETLIAESGVVESATGEIEATQDTSVNDAAEASQSSEEVVTDDTVVEEPTKIHYTDDEGFSCDFHCDINGIEVKLEGNTLSIKDNTYTGITESEAKTLKRTFKQVRNATSNNETFKAKENLLRTAQTIAENYK